VASRLVFVAVATLAHLPQPLSLLLTFSLTFYPRKTTKEYTMQLIQRQSAKAIQPKNEIFECPEVLGAKHSVPLLDGRYVPQIFLDNAASTKPFKVVSDFLQEIQPYYSNIHRGTGFDSSFCTERYEQARRIVGDFVGWDSDRDVVIPVRNTTEGMNLLANTISFAPGDRVLTTILEHHSNDLPWRSKAKVEHLPINSEGQIDLEELERRLDPTKGRVRVVSMTGASNITGTVLPIHEIATLAHKYGALMVVDGAQLVPHRRVTMKPHTDPSHIDFLVFSGHKMNCPTGVGAVVGRRDIFSAAAPYQTGGGTISTVTVDSITWAAPPDRNEAGTPNVLGLLALARTIQVLEAVGMDAIDAHERELTALLLEKLNRIPQVKVLGSSNPEAMEKRVGAVSFTVEGVPHNLVAAILSFEWGIAVRNGTFCAQPLMKHLLNTNEDFICGSKSENAARLSGADGAVRASLGVHNTEQDIETLVEAVTSIAQKQWKGDYEQASVFLIATRLRRDPSTRLRRERSVERSGRRRGS
jgi:cysteine desulfurase/selenocysteine lyase